MGIITITSAGEVRIQIEATQEMVEELRPHWSMATVDHIDRLSATVFVLPAFPKDLEVQRCRVQGDRPSACENSKDNREHHDQ